MLLFKHQRKINEKNCFLRVNYPDYMYEGGDFMSN